MNEKWEKVAERKKLIDREQHIKLQDMYQKMSDEGLIMTSSTSNPLINVKKEFKSQNQR